MPVSRFILASLCLAAYQTVLPIHPLCAQTGDPPGRIAGTVVDAETDAPLFLANIVVDGTDWGAISREDGSFTVEGVLPGVYTVKVLMMGYERVSETEVVVRSLRTTDLDFRLDKTIVMEITIEVKEERQTRDIGSSATERNIDPEEAKVRSVDTVQDLLEKEPGVVAVAGQLHIRGARSNETLVLVDGMPVSDPLGGAGSMNVSLAALDDVRLLSGGFDAEYGNAQAAVIEMRTKEGSNRFTGLVKFMTDDFGAPDKTYFNTDNVLLGLGGPTPIRGLTFYTSGEGVFTDTYLRTTEDRTRRRFLGFEFRERQLNSYRGQGKLSWRLGDKKLVGEMLRSEETFDLYNHRYSREGYWSPTAGPDGLGMWWFEPLDSTFTYYSGPEHTPNILNRQTHGRLRLTHTLSDQTVWTAAFGVHRIHREVGVKDLETTEYSNSAGTQDDLDPLNLFYYIRGDIPVWARERTSTYTLRADVTSERRDVHRLKSGIEVNVWDIENDTRSFPGPSFPLGQFPDRYRVRPWGASCYLQDRLTHEGMIVNAGLRLDAFDPSKKAYDRGNARRVDLGLNPMPSGLLDRLTLQISPRLGMAYPITDRDVLHFHYGRFQEVPRLGTLYEHTGSDANINPSSTVGNPFLDATTSISYQVGVEHQFTKRSSINLTFFYKDIFGLIGTDTESAAVLDPRNQPGVRYVNRDYGTAQGLEFSIRKHLTATGRWAGGLSYTYSQARGSSSSETQGFNVITGGQDRVPITELPLDWDVPHLVSGNLYVTALNNWGMNVELSYASGTPYTPLTTKDKETPSDRINTGRLPATFELSFKADKRYKIYGQEFSLFLEGRNVTDRLNVFDLEPAQANDYYNPYYTEYGKLGGAYNLRDVRQDLDEDVLVPLNDPRVFGEPRSFRMGIQFDW